LFSIKGPRDTTPLLDIERALNKLEKVALKRRETQTGPLVVIINSIHLIRDDGDGKDLIEMIQQRAEQWAASNLVTFSESKVHQIIFATSANKKKLVFNSDDYWIYERLKRYASRMEVIPVTDLPKRKAMTALRRYRKQYRQEDTPQEILEKVYDSVGGRLSFLNRVANSDDMLATCRTICEAEKTWFLNRCWILGEEMDDDVMDQQKYSVSLNFIST
jgi:hypothetical protein